MSSGAAGALPIMVSTLLSPRSTPVTSRCAMPPVLNVVAGQGDGVIKMQGFVPAIVAVGYFERRVEALQQAMESALTRLMTSVLYEVRPTDTLTFSLAVLVVKRDSLWNHELAALSPVSAQDQALDQQLRADLGAPDVRFLVVVQGSSEGQVLAAAERALLERPLP